MSNLINSIDQVILENDLPFEWSDKINKELKDISPNKTLKRIDLRKKSFVTIDGKDAKDFDDAVYCEKDTDGFILQVAIADVADIVESGSEIDKEAVKRVKEFITNFDNKLNILVLETTARTAKDAANSLQCEVGAIVKSLLFKAEDSFLICLVAGDKRCSLNKLKKILQKKDVSMASPDEVKKNTGFSIGGVSPVAHLKKLDVFIDKSLNRFKFIFAAAGHPNCVFKISFDQLVKITNGSEKEISE